MGVRVLSVIMTCAALAAGCSGASSAVRNDPLMQTGSDLYSAAKAGDLQLTQQSMGLGGFDPKEPNYEGILPLGAAAMGGNVEIIWLMVSEGADVNEADLTGKTPLQYAREAGHEEAAAYLIELGAVE